MGAPASRYNFEEECEIANQIDEIYDVKNEIKRGTIKNDKICSKNDRIRPVPPEIENFKGAVGSSIPDSESIDRRLKEMPNKFKTVIQELKWNEVRRRIKDSNNLNHFQSSRQDNLPVSHPPTRSSRPPSRGPKPAGLDVYNMFDPDVGHGRGGKHKSFDFETLKSKNDENTLGTLARSWRYGSSESEYPPIGMRYF